jgi:hypothetical protein
MVAETGWIRESWGWSLHEASLARTISKLLCPENKNKMRGFFAALRMTAVWAARREQATAKAKCRSFDFAQDDNFWVR